MKRYLERFMSLLIIICIIGVLFLFNSLVREKNFYENCINSIIQLNLNSISDSIEHANEQLKNDEDFDEVIENLYFYCYPSVKSLETVKVEEYTLFELQNFLLVANGKESFSKEEKILIIEKLNYVKTLFDILLEKTAEGGTKQEVYNYLDSKDENMKKIMSDIEEQFYLLTDSL